MNKTNKRRAAEKSPAVKVSISLPARMAEALRAQALYDGTTVSHIVRTALRGK